MTDKERIGELEKKISELQTTIGEQTSLLLYKDKQLQNNQNQKTVEALREAYNYAIKHYNEEEKDMKVAVAYRKCATRISELISELGGKDE